MLKMECPYVKTFCCLFSVKVGTLMISYISQLFAFISFVAWVSTGFVVYVKLKHSANHTDEENFSHYLTLIHAVFGIILMLAQTAMGCVLWKGLHKDDPRLLRIHQYMGVGMVLVNICNAIIAAQYTAYVLVFPIAMAIPLQAYFLLVIRSAVKEMEDEQLSRRFPRIHLDPENGMPFNICHLTV